MKSELGMGMLHVFASKNNDRGFTLIELLVFIIINSLLAATAIPIFLTQAQRAEQVEAKRSIGVMNRAQQAYYLEHQNVFADAVNFNELGLGMGTETKNYTYAITGGGNGASFVTNQAHLKVANSLFKAYIGGAAVITQKDSLYKNLSSVLCEGSKPAVNGGPIGTEIIVPQRGKAPKCPNAYSTIK